MQPFYKIDHAATFRAYFDILARNGVDVVATTPDSVVADAGAWVIPLEDVLAAPGIAQSLAAPRGPAVP